MGIIDIIRKMQEKKAITKARFKEVESEEKIHKLIEERKKSSNRRELEKYVKDQEEIQIKNQLDKIRKKQQEDNWSGKNSLVNQKMTILQDDKPILMQKNIFLDNKSKIPLNKQEMFFRW